MQQKSIRALRYASRNDNHPRPVQVSNFGDTVAEWIVVIGAAFITFLGVLLFVFERFGRLIFPKVRR